jgi:TP901 family phage tail tape measure protein
MANVTGDAAEKVSDQLTAIWNNFYDGSKSLEYYADVITALGAATASSTSEISEGLEKFASIAATIGLSYEYATTSLATIVDQTRQAPETVGTALKTIFARIQGLSLGETLDDGTDLNKYSEALSKVGINIFDANGQLKDMDALLDELGNKWDTLNKAQQMALAQTVAGVRQYTQLVALLDNWDSFQANLTTALTAEGELDHQAEIYADSWEAARNRVRASAEGIYDSIIDDDLFIELNNNVANVLDIIEQVIDSFNGLGGILTLTGTLMTRVYGDKLA